MPIDDNATLRGLEHDLLEQLAVHEVTHSTCKYNSNIASENSIRYQVLDDEGCEN